MFEKVIFKNKINKRLRFKVSGYLQRENFKY